MAWIDRQVSGKRGQLAEGAGQGAGIAAGQVGAADGAAEKRIAGEEGVVVLELPADAARSVAGGFDDGPARAGEFEDGAFLDMNNGPIGLGWGVVESWLAGLGSDLSEELVIGVEPRLSRVPWNFGGGPIIIRRRSRSHLDAWG